MSAATKCYICHAPLLSEETLEVVDELDVADLLESVKCYDPVGGRYLGAAHFYCTRCENIKTHYI